MIKTQKALTMAEVVSLAGDSEKEKNLKQFVKKFVSIDEETAKKMKQELMDLNLIKLKEENTVKIVDFMPQDASELTKVLPGIPLNQDEITQILDIVKKY
jgi:DNA-directed RNA polymerase subunit F